jgi:GT2 family glycosyltransferase
MSSTTLSGNKLQAGKSKHDSIGTILVPVHQDVSFLEVFLKSLEQTVEGPTNVILTDDGCGASTRELMQAWKEKCSTFLNVRLLRNEKPQGAGASLNKAMANATDDIVFILDSDLILQPGWQGAFFQHLNRLEKAAAIGGMLLYPQTGGVNHCGITVYGDVARHLFLNARPDEVQRAPYSVQLMGIAFTALRRSQWLDVGGMDERFFNGYEDFDLFMRLKKAGGELYIAPEITGYHWERSNGPHRSAGRKGNLARFWNTWGKMLENDLWNFLQPNFNKKIDHKHSQRLVALDLSQDRVSARMFWSDLALCTECRPTHIRDLSHRVVDNEPIWLPVVAGAESDREPGQYIILTDNFVRLRGNRYWIAQRELIRGDDIVVDLNANVISLSSLAQSAWPGEKIR